MPMIFPKDLKIVSLELMTIFVFNKAKKKTVVLFLLLLNKYQNIQVGCRDVEEKRVSATSHCCRAISQLLPGSVTYR